MTAQHFEFHEWEKAFTSYAEAIKVYGEDSIMLVVCVHPYASGYWVEQTGNTVTEFDFVVRPENINAYYERVKEHIAYCKERGKSVNKFIKP